MRPAALALPAPLPLLAAVALCLTACPEKRPDAPPWPGAAASAPATLAPPDWSAPPVPGSAPRWAPPAVKTFALENGLTVWFLPQTQVPLASVTLLLPRGAATDPAGKAGATALMADLLDEGAGGQSAIALGDAWQRLGTDYDAGVSTDGVTLSMHLLADQLDASLALMAAVALKPDFPPAEFERRKAQRQASLLAAEADPATSRSVVLRRVLFGDGYGGLPADGVRGTLAKVTLDDVKGQYGRLFTPQGAAMVVVGALDEGAARAAIERHFGAWHGQAPVPAAPVTPAPEPAGVYLIDHPGATQSAIAIATRTGGANAPDLYAALDYNWAIGGAFMSRVNLKLREEKGYTYGARSGFNRWRDAGFFSVAALVKAQFTRESVGEMLDAVRLAATEKPISAQEIAEAKGGLLLSFPGRFENMGAVAGQLVELPLYGRSPDWYTQWPARVDAVTAEDVQAVARGHGDPTRYVVVVAGDRQTVAPALAPLGLPVHVYDAQGNALTP